MVLDNWAEAGRNFSEGKFGFLVQGDDQIGISDFHVPAEIIGRSPTCRERIGRSGTCPT